MLKYTKWWIMEEALIGLLTVLICFIICILVGGIIVYFKQSSNKGNKKNKVTPVPTIFYIDNKNFKKSKPKTKVTIPFEATVVDPKDLKKYFTTDFKD